MDFFDVVKTRHSVRKYERRPIEQDKLNTILQTINSAPSAGDLQGYEVIVVKNQSTKDALCAAAHGQQSVSEAPLVLVFVADHARSAEKYGKRGHDLYSIQDASIAVTYAILAATSLGLATVWVGAFDPAAAARAVNAPNYVTPVAILPVGYASESPSSTPRRDLDDIIRWESFE